MESYRFSAGIYVIITSLQLHGSRFGGGFHFRYCNAKQFSCKEKRRLRVGKPSLWGVSSASHGGETPKRGNGKLMGVSFPIGGGLLGDKRRSGQRMGVLPVLGEYITDM